MSERAKRTPSRRRPSSCTRTAEMAASRFVKAGAYFETSCEGGGFDTYDSDADTAAYGGDEL